MPKEIADLARGALSMLRASDTFKWLTEDAAQQLEDRAKARLGALAKLEAASVPRLDQGADQEELVRVLRRAGAESAAQMKLAEFLRSLGDQEGHE